MQFDLGDEEDSGKMGAIARRDKEIRTTEKRTLTGLPGKSLYLEALQLILRTQLLWLINTKGFRPELETVVRDLWDLRIRGFGSLVPEEHTKEAELEVFSSQPLSENGDEKKGAFGRRSWDPERGSDWPMPRFVDTLGLCYLGCLLLKTPVRIGEISGWANGGTIPYKRAVRLYLSSRKWILIGFTVLCSTAGDAGSNAFGLYAIYQNPSSYTFRWG